MTAQEKSAIVQAEQAERVARSHGHLVIIGGGEDKQRDMAILKRFVELAGGPSARIVVITAASSVAGNMWETYDRAFADLGVTRHVHLHLQLHLRRRHQLPRIRRHHSQPSSRPGRCRRPPARRRSSGWRASCRLR